MFTRIANIKLAIVVLICVLFLFFCPANDGPFSATHGPLTTGRSRFYAYLLTWSIRLGIVSYLLRIRRRVQRLRELADSLVLLQLFPRALAFDLRC